jgi:hypothetical protein
MQMVVPIKTAVSQGGVNKTPLLKVVVSRWRNLLLSDTDGAFEGEVEPISMLTTIQALLSHSNLFIH